MFIKMCHLHHDLPNEIIIGQYKLIMDKRVLIKEDQQRLLTKKEAQLLQYLAVHANMEVERYETLRNIWGKETYKVGRSMDVFICRLRKYLGEDSNIHLDNVRSLGFKLCVN
jgi:DNA-binding response OmpR family regulator